MKCSGFLAGKKKNLRVIEKKLLEKERQRDPLSHAGGINAHMQVWVKLKSMRAVIE